MNELTNNKTMTIKELANVAGCNQKTVRVLAKKLFPELLKKGIQTQFTNDQAIGLMIKLPKKNFVQKSQQPITKVQGNKIDRLENMVEKLCLAVTQIISIPKQQIEFIQDYYSILGYTNKNQIKITFSEAIKFVKEATKESNSQNKEIRKIDDERFGQVNSYHLDVLNKIFSM